MEVVGHPDPASFRAAAADYLMRDEPRHNLLLGLLGTLIDQPEVFPEHRLWLVEERGELRCAALQTPPHNVVVSVPAVPGAVEALADALASEGVEVPGVMGALPEADTFARRYTEKTGGRIASRMDQAIHVLEAVEPVPEPPGAPRRAGPEDFDLVLDWYRRFGAEADPHSPWNEEQARRRLRGRLAGEGGHGIRLWEDGGPVCLVGFIDATANSARVGPVYTPPARRRRGYATALVAHVSREVLDRGKRFCMLYTDLANPTSNAIYQRIGYERTCDAAMIAFAAVS